MATSAKTRRFLGVLLTILAAGAGVVIMQVVKYSAGGESWLFSGWGTGYRPSVSASLDASGRYLLLDPGDTWRDVTITLYTGSVPWTYSLSKVTNGELKIPLIQFADADGNRFKPAEKRPNQLRIRGVVSVPVEQPDGGMIGRPRRLTVDRKLIN